VLRAQASRLEHSHALDSALILPGLPSLEHVLVDVTGRQHAVLRGNGTSLQLLIDGPEIAVQRVAITFLVQGFGAIRETCEHLATLRRIISTATPRSALPRWTAATRKLHAALVALDGRAAGATHRDVALVLYGFDYVKRNWESGLKSRMRHHLQRGLKLSRGGYRKFLR